MPDRLPERETIDPGVMIQRIQLKLAALAQKEPPHRRAALLADARAVRDADDATVAANLLEVFARDEITLDALDLFLVLTAAGRLFRAGGGAMPEVAMFSSPGKPPSPN